MSLRHLFRGSEGRQAGSPGLSVGERFPLDVSSYARNGEPVTFCFISLHCLSCIDLLPELKEYEEQLKHSFVLVCNGDEEDLAAIRSHFGFEFAMEARSEEQFVNLFGIRHTPYVYAATSDGEIIVSAPADTIADLYRLTMEL